MRTTTWIQFFLLFSVVFTTFSTYAIGCNDVSPNMKIQGEKYYEIKEAEKLTRQQKDTVKKLASVIKSRMDGSGLVAICKGPVNDFKKVTNREKLSARIKSNADGKLTITVDVYNVEKKSSYTDVIEFFGKNNLYVIEDLTETGFTVVHKMRQKVGRSGLAALIEENTKLNVNDGRLSIEVVRYINGYFAEERNWEFH